MLGFSEDRQTVKTGKKVVVSVLLAIYAAYMLALVLQAAFNTRGIPVTRDFPRLFRHQAAAGSATRQLRSQSMATGPIHQLTRSDVLPHLNTPSSRGSNCWTLLASQRPCECTEMITAPRSGLIFRTESFHQNRLGSPYCLDHPLSMVR